MNSRKLWVLALVFLLNTGYVAAFGTPSLFYMANALLHTLLGLALLAFLLLAVLPSKVGQVGNLRRVGTPPERT